MTDTKGFGIDEDYPELKKPEPTRNEFLGGFKLTKKATHDLFAIGMTAIGLIALGFGVPFSGWVLFFGLASFVFG